MFVDLTCNKRSARLERDKLCHAKMPPYSMTPLVFNFNARVRARTRVAFTYGRLCESNCGQPSR